MKNEEVAKQIDGREYPFDINNEEESAFKELGIVVCYGHSDDLLEFRGAIYDEVGAWNGVTAKVDKDGLLELERDNDWTDDEMEEWLMRKKTAHEIEAVWNDHGPEPAWTIKTEIPHTTFDIVEDGEVQSRGIVFNIKDL